MKQSHAWAELPKGSLAVATTVGVVSNVSHRVFINNAAEVVRWMRQLPGRRSPDTLTNACSLLPDPVAAQRRSQAKGYC